MSEHKTTRRNRLDLHTPAEAAITAAMYAVENMPADVLLTQAGILLSQARDKVSDFIDREEAARMASLKRNTGNVWIPESPLHPGLYANDLVSADGKVAFGAEVSTHNVYAAKQFATKSECETWCKAHPVPVFVPVEHGFAEPPGRN